jgi:DNA-binding MarR family transcriptional regulator
MERFTRMMFTRIITGLARTLRDEEFTVAQIAALHLVDQEGTLRVSALAEALGLSASAGSRLVDGLVQRGLLTRAEDPQDRRARVISLSDDGRRFIERASIERVAVVEESARSLPGRLSELMSAVLAEFRRR